MIVHDSRTPITIVGLGPGDASLLTVEARDTLAAATDVWLRTARHPTVAGLPPGPRYESFDDVYDSGASFEDVYARIVERVLELSARPDGVVYAVPGHPLFGEATTRAIVERAGAAGVAVRIVAGLSFVDAVVTALKVDPLADGLLLLDALALTPKQRLLVPERPAIIAQVYDRRTASHAKLGLLAAYPAEHPVSIVRASGAREGAVTAATVATLDHADSFDHLVSLYVPPLPLIEDVRTFEGLRAVIAQLRDPDGGCPWDLEQSHETLRRYLLEEAYEAIDALDEGEPKRLSEELGDLLMQVVLHAQVAEDHDEFTIEDVIASITAKLVRRHPHVFGDVEVSGAEDVLRNWESLKNDERGDAPLLDAVPIAMPALAQAQSVLGRANKAGLGRRASAEALSEALAPVLDGEADAERLGEALFGIVAIARGRDIDAEEALRLAVRRYRQRVAEEEAAARGGQA